MKNGRYTTSSIFNGSAISRRGPIWQSTVWRKEKDALQSVDHAISTMLQAFQDELFLVLHNEEPLDSLSTPLNIQEDDVLHLLNLLCLQDEFGRRDF